MEIDESIKALYTRASYIGAELDIQNDGKGITVVLLVPVK
jgi:hypothetical protein